MTVLIRHDRVVPSVGMTVLIKCYTNFLETALANVARRLAEHNNPDHKPTKYTSKQAGPWRLIYEESCRSRSEAMRRERWLKTGTGRRWLNAKLGGASPPQAD